MSPHKGPVSVGKDDQEVGTVNNVPDVDEKQTNMPVNTEYETIKKDSENNVFDNSEQLNKSNQDLNNSFLHNYWNILTRYHVLISTFSKNIRPFQPFYVVFTNLVFNITTLFTFNVVMFTNYYLEKRIYSPQLKVKYLIYFKRILRMCLPMNLIK